MKLIKIDKIETFPYKGKVYDLEVQSATSYNVFNIIVHNSICTTRYATGFHVPTLQSVNDARDLLLETGYQIPIITDGGAKHYGDVYKALTFGATMVMSGGWFASCIDSPAKIINGSKIYRGSTSYEMKGHKKNIEGKQIELVEGTTYEQRLLEIKGAIQSSISYAGGNDLSAFKSVSWGRILPFH